MATGKKLRNLFLFVLSTLLVVAWTSSSWADLPAENVSITCPESVIAGQAINCTSQASPTAGETVTYLWNTDKGEVTVGQGSNTASISSPSVGNSTISINASIPGPANTTAAIGNIAFGGAKPGGWSNPRVHYQLPSTEWPGITGNGNLTKFRWIGTTHSSFKFALLYGGQFKWISPDMNQNAGGQTWTPPAPVPVGPGYTLAIIVPDGGAPMTAVAAAFGKAYYSAACYGSCQQVGQSPTGFTDVTRSMNYGADFLSSDPPPPIVVTKTASVAVTEPPAPTITSFDGPTTTTERKTEHYTVTTNASDPATLTFAWSVNGVSYSGSAVDVPFPTAGSYNVSVTVYPTGYPNSASTSTKIVTVAAKVNFTCTESVETGQPISCTAQVVPDGSETLTYLWTVNQGEVTAGQGTNQVTISSPIVGQTTVSLKVTASVPAPTPVTVGFVYSNSSAHTTPLPQNTVTVFANISGNRLPNGSWITSFKYIAGRIKPFRFVLANSLNSSSMELKWISPEITPSAIGENTWAPESPIKVEGSNMYLGYYTYTGDAQTVNYKAVLDGGRERSNATMALGVIETYSKVNWVPSMSAETISELPVPPADYTKTVNVAVMELPAPTITSFDGPTTAMEGNTERYIFTARSSSTLTFEWKVNGISYTGSEMPPLPGLDQAQRLDIDFATPGSYDVKVTVYPTGHPNAATIETKGVTVAQHPAPALTLNGPVSTSEGKTERYTVTIDSEEPMTIAWDINGVSYSGSEIDVPFTTPGSYAVKVTAYPTGYPNSSITRTLTVNAAQYPAPTLTLNGATSTTEGKTEHYTATTDAADPSSVTITWDVNGVSHTGSEIDVPFMAPGNYDLVVTVYPNAYPNSTRTRTLTVLVTQHPIPVIILDGPRTTVEGRTERYTVTTNQTEPMTITWDVNGVYYSGSEVNIAFPTEGSYGVNVTVYPTGYPSSSRTGTLTVVAAKNPAPLITSLDGPRSTTEGNTEQYSITTNAANPATISTVWTINGVEYTGSPVNITFPAAGSYDLSVKVYPTGFPNSSRTGTMPVVVLAVKAPLVGINPPKKGEVNTEMTLSATVKNQSNIETMVMKWTMPDGTIVNSATAKYTPRLEDVGTATFLFTAYPEGYPNSKKEVVVSVPITKYEMPAFTLKPYHKPTGIAPYSVFYAINVALKGSTEKFTYAWDMGDGTAMPAKNKANHTYSAPGEYTVKLTVSDTKGNSQVIEDTVTVTPVMPIIVDSISVKATNKYMKAPVTGMFRPTISGGNPTKDRFATYAWTINGEAVGRNANSMVYKFETPGTFIIGLTVTSKSGLTGTGLQSIEVNPNDPPECTIDYEDIPAKKTTKLVANCTDVDGKIREINWDLGNGKTAKNKTVNYKYAEAGTYTVTLTATDDSKGQTTVSREIVVTR
ncbi:MAG: PKD domain-containing protein [Syntrophus sp. (in: bacteria)]